MNRCLGGWQRYHREDGIEAMVCSRRESIIGPARNLYYSVNNGRVSYYLGHVICHLNLSEPDVFGKYDEEEGKMGSRTVILGERTGH